MWHETRLKKLEIFVLEKKKLIGNKRDLNFLKDWQVA